MFFSYKYHKRELSRRHGGLNRQVQHYDDDHGTDINFRAIDVLCYSEPPSPLPTCLPRQTPPEYTNNPSYASRASPLRRRRHPLRALAFLLPRRKDLRQTLLRSITLPELADLI